MKIYFAGGENNYWQKALDQAGSNKELYSHFYLDKDNGKKKDNFIERNNILKKDIFLDSGGFSAFTKGADINIQDYITFIKKHKKIIKTYAVLDVIGDYKKTMANQKIMEEAGLTPLPVFHYGTDFKILKEISDKYDYLALGGMVPIARSKQKLLDYLKYCFSVIRKNKKVHGFGMTGIDILKTIPFYSVDSTRWLGGSMRAEIYKFNGSGMDMIKTKNQNKASHKTISLTDNNDKKWFNRVVNNAIEFIKLEKYITDLWAKRGVVWKD